MLLTIWALVGFVVFSIFKLPVDKHPYLSFLIIIITGPIIWTFFIALLIIEFLKKDGVIRIIIRNEIKIIKLCSQTRYLKCKMWFNKHNLDKLRTKIAKKQIQLAVKKFKIRAMEKINDKKEN